MPDKRQNRNRLPANYMYLARYTEENNGDCRKDSTLLFTTRHWLLIVDEVRERAIVSEAKFDRIWILYPFDPFDRHSLSTIQCRGYRANWYYFSSFMLNFSNYKKKKNDKYSNIENLKRKKKVLTDDFFLNCSNFKLYKKIIQT